MWYCGKLSDVAEVVALRAKTLLCHIMEFKSSWQTSNVNFSKHIYQNYIKFYKWSLDSKLSIKLKFVKFEALDIKLFTEI